MGDFQGTNPWEDCSIKTSWTWIFVPELPNSNHSVIPKVGLLEKVMLLGQQCSVFDLGVYFTQFLLYRKVFMHHKCNYLQRKILVYCPTFFVWTVNVCLSIGLYVCTELHYNDILFQNLKKNMPTRTSLTTTLLNNSVKGSTGVHLYCVRLHSYYPLVNFVHFVQNFSILLSNSNSHEKIHR